MVIQVVLGEAYYRFQIKTRAMESSAKMEAHLPEELCMSLDWQSNPASKRLLDAIVAGLVEEYIQTAKEHPELFSKD